MRVHKHNAPKRFVAAKGEHIRNRGEKTIPFKTSEGIHRCITFRSASVVKPLISIRKVVQAGNVVVLDEKNSHIRNTRDGTTIKLEQRCIYNGHVGMFGRNRIVFQLAGTVTRSKAVNELVRPVDCVTVKIHSMRL